MYICGTERKKRENSNKKTERGVKESGQDQLKSNVFVSSSLSKSLFQYLFCFKWNLLERS